MYSYCYCKNVDKSCYETNYSVFCLTNCSDCENYCFCYANCLNLNFFFPVAYNFPLIIYLLYFLLVSTLQHSISS